MPDFRERYCSKHNIVHYDSRCPQCREDEERQQFEKTVEPLRKAKRKREAQEQLCFILAKLEKATLVKETTLYKQLICPYCHESSLFFYKSIAKYECLNRHRWPCDCPLNASLNFWSEQSNQ